MRCSFCGSISFQLPEKPLYSVVGNLLYPSCPVHYALYDSRSQMKYEAFRLAEKQEEERRVNRGKGEVLVLIHKDYI